MASEHERRPSKTRTLAARLMSHGARYWVTAALVLAFSLAVAPRVEEFLHLQKFQYGVYQRLSELAPRPLLPRSLKVVLIQDDEFWLGPPSGRRPLKRKYLADLVRALDEANVRAIALDFDLRTPDPSSARVPPEFEEETLALVRTLGDVAQRRKVILARTIWYDENERRGAKLEPDIYNAFGICVQPRGDGSWENPGSPAAPLTPDARANISCGFVALPTDLRLLPGRLELSDGTTIDSFSLAVARARNPELVGDISTSARFGSYIPHEVLWRTTVSAASIRQRDPPTMARLQSEVVIVGGAWRTLAHGRGASVDTYETPVGPEFGALIHANFAEAMLDSRVFVNTPGWLMRVLEIAFSVLASALFALFPKVVAKLGILAAVSVFLIAMQWVVLHALGVVFESLVPVFGLWLHSVIERLIE